MGNLRALAGNEPFRVKKEMKTSIGSGSGKNRSEIRRAQEPAEVGYEYPGERAISRNRVS
jgi:hypothetical protein